MVPSWSKEAIALNPDEPSAHYKLGLAYDQKNDFAPPSANTARQAPPMPQRLDARQNLGAALMHQDPAGANRGDFESCRPGP